MFYHLPSAASSFISSKPKSSAIAPNTEKIAVEAIKEVTKSRDDTRTAS